MFKGIIRKTVEEDNFVQGCVGNYTDFGVMQEIDGCNTIEDLLKRFSDYFGKKIEEVDFCDGWNEFRISRMENDGGDLATAKELEEWEAERMNIWSADYYLSVQEVEDVASEKLEEALKNLKGK